MAEDGSQQPSEALKGAQEALRAVEQILEAVEADEIEASTPKARALLRQLQGAAAALREVVTGG